MTIYDLLGLGIRSGNELRKELSKAYIASMSEFRNDEGTEFDARFYAFWDRYRALEAAAKELGFDWSLEGVPDLSTPAQKTQAADRKHLEAIDEAISKAKRERSIAACEMARLALENVIPSGGRLLDEIQLVPTLIAPTGRLMRLALELGFECLSMGDLSNSQEFWILALAASDALRSRATGTKVLLRNRIGQPVRHRWPLRYAEQFHLSQSPRHSPAAAGAGDSRRGCREASSHLFSRWAEQSPRDIGEIIGRDESFSGPAVKPSLESTIILSYRFIDDDLIAFLDGRTDRFIYGDDFADYGYTPDKVRPSPLICAPIIRKGVRQDIVHLTRTLHDVAVGESTGNYSFAELLDQLSNILATDEVDRSLVSFCENARKSPGDLLLIVVPDGVLHRIPFAFLRTADGVPLIERYAAVSSALSLLTLKWQIMTYVWRCLPFLPEGRPRCLFIGVPSTTIDSALPELPGVQSEWANLRVAFGDDGLLAFSDSSLEAARATIDNIATYHQDAEIVWFAGHGVDEEATSLSSQKFELPRVGFVLPDSVLTSDLFYQGEPWNFSRSWIGVFNACLLGQLFERGTEMVGLLASLYLVGMGSLVTCLWPVGDDLAVQFAREFSQRLIRIYIDSDRRKKEFVKARCFADTLRSLSRKYDSAHLACYSYFGTP